jgi:hypothetical protein
MTRLLRWITSAGAGWFKSGSISAERRPLIFFRSVALKTVRPRASSLPSGVTIFDRVAGVKGRLPLVRDAAGEQASFVFGQGPHGAFVHMNVPLTFRPKAIQRFRAERASALGTKRVPMPFPSKISLTIPGLRPEAIHTSTPDAMANRAAANLLAIPPTLFVDPVPAWTRASMSGVTWKTSGKKVAVGPGAGEEAVHVGQNEEVRGVHFRGHEGGEGIVVAEFISWVATVSFSLMMGMTPRSKRAVKVLRILR